MYRRTLTVILVAVSAIGHADEPRQEPSPRHAVGRAVSAEEIKALDLSVFPDGAGLPPGRGTVHEGKQVFAAQCAACHGDHGEGRGDYPALVGGRGSLGTPTPVLTVGSYWPYATSIWDYIRRAMPYQSAGSLTANEVYALTAWLLYANGIVEENVVLDQRTLARVKMPNRDGFVDDPRPDVR